MPLGGLSAIGFPAQCVGQTGELLVRFRFCSLQLVDARLEFDLISAEALLLGVKLFLGRCQFLAQLSQLSFQLTPLTARLDDLLFGRLPAWGLYVRHATGLQLRDISLRLLNPDARPAVVLDDVSGLRVRDCDGLENA